MATPEKNNSAALSAMDNMIEVAKTKKATESRFDGKELLELDAVTDMLAGIDRGEITAREALAKVGELLKVANSTHIDSGENGSRRALVEATLRKIDVATGSSEAGEGVAEDIQKVIENSRRWFAS